MAARKLSGPQFYQIISPLSHAARMSTSVLSQPNELRASPHRIPKFLYGTAWKKERTADLVYEALKSGFKGIDTAAQPRHYNEKLVGDGIRQAIREGIVKREDIFIQTKFSPTAAQDLDNLPYDPSLPIPSQIHASLASSLKNLSPEGDGSSSYIDSLVLHSPLREHTDTLLAISILRPYLASGAIRSIGISNVSFPILASLVSSPETMPTVVQNRFIGRTGFDKKIRQLCREHGIIYQSFWTLTGNPELLQMPEIGIISKKTGVSREVVLYALVIGLENITVLNGTTHLGRMRDDVNGLEKVGQWAQGEGREEWDEYLAEFQVLVG